MKRRQFVKSVSATGLGLAAARSPLLALGGSPAEKVVVAVMGLNGRGTVLGRVFGKTPNAEVAYVCDVDSQVLAKGLASVGEAQGKTPKGLVDFRRALDDKGVDALVIAAPDHWHAPATILALSAGKHVYLEKPCGHNPRDRKSTRLNSSHVSISYAVFCLKKKKNYKNQHSYSNKHTQYIIASNFLNVR